MNDRVSPGQYAGFLTPTQAAAGIDAALRKARSLLADADLPFAGKFLHVSDPMS
jgi:hypothetical protein